MSDIHKADLMFAAARQLREDYLACYLSSLSLTGCVGLRTDLDWYRL